MLIVIICLGKDTHRCVQSHSPYIKAWFESVFVKDPEATDDSNIKIDIILKKSKGLYREHDKNSSYVDYNIDVKEVKVASYIVCEMRVNCSMDWISFAKFVMPKKSNFKIAI